MTLFFCRWQFDMYEIWQTGAVSLPTAVIWSKSKPEIEFQYGGRFFIQNGNSYTSAAD